MANPKKRRPENQTGSFFVDSTCIDCGMCYWMAPRTFSEVGEMSAVTEQPSSPEEKLAALQALVSCPTGSIGCDEGTDLIQKAIASFPYLIDENVYHCGFHSPKSYGATSYLIKRPRGNVLVDSPKFVNSLVRKIEEMGGIKFLYLTHQDDVADHQKYHDHFKCERILHKDDSGRVPKMEIEIAGGENFQLDNELQIIFVPGHTKGHTALLYKKFLFTGDHLHYSRELKHLCAYRSVCWYSWPEQINSVRKLLNYDFEWVLPGHGERFHSSSLHMKEQVQKAVSWMASRG